MTWTEQYQFAIAIVLLSMVVSIVVYSFCYHKWIRKHSTWAFPSRIGFLILMISMIALIGVSIVHYSKRVDYERYCLRPINISRILLPQDRYDGDMPTPNNFLWECIEQNGEIRGARKEIFQTDEVRITALIQVKKNDNYPDILFMIESITNHDSECVFFDPKFTWYEENEPVSWSACIGSLCVDGSRFLVAVDYNSLITSVEIEFDYAYSEEKDVRKTERYTVDLAK